jgi:hypothetical protein
MVTIGPKSLEGVFVVDVSSVDVIVVVVMSGGVYSPSVVVENVLSGSRVVVSFSVVVEAVVVQPSVA